jgi:hypothetical protein
VSTILQALKRLEKERAVRTAPTQPAMLQSFDTRQVLHRAAAFSWLRGKVLTWSVAALAISVGAIAWHLYSRSGPPGPQMPPPSTHGVQQATVPSGARPQAVADATPRAKSAPARDGRFASEDQWAAPVQPPVAPPAARAAPARQAPGDYAGAERLTDERLTVQAIAWSTNADDRMAVINNRVVREGNVVDGFTIVAIEEQIIYVREGGRLWQVRFGQQ